MAKLCYVLACLFAASASSSEVPQATCKGCDESALVQKDMTIRSYAAATSDRTQVKTAAENRIQHYQTAAASITKLVQDMNQTMLKHFKETGQDYSDLVDTTMTTIMAATRTLAFDVLNTRRLFAPVRYISTSQAAPLVATLIKGFDASNVEEAMTNGRASLMHHAIDSSKQVRVEVISAVNPVEKELKALNSAIAALKPDSQEADLLHKDMHNVERSIENAENMLQTAIASHGRQFGIELNEQIWKMEDSVSMFKHDMHNMRDLAEHMEMDKQILKMFGVFDSRADDIQARLESAHTNLTKAGRKLETHHLLNTTNQALDAALQTTSLLSPVAPVSLLQEEESGASHVGLSLLSLAFLSQWL